MGTLPMFERLERNISGSPKELPLFVDSRDLVEIKSHAKYLLEQDSRSITDGPIDPALFLLKSFTIYLKRRGIECPLEVKTR